MKYIFLSMACFYIAACSENSPAKTNIEDSSTIKAVKEEARDNASAGTDSIPGVNNGGSTVSGNTGGASPGSGISMPANTDSAKKKTDSSKKNK